MLSADNMYIFRTPGGDAPTYEHFWLVSEVDYLLFNVRACAQASVAITKAPYVTENDNCFEVVIGYNDNLQTVIRTTVGDDGSTVASADTPDVLDCNFPRPFWLSWFGGHIKLGQGHVLDEQLLVDYNDGDVRTIGAKSFGSYIDDNAFWHVLKDAGAHDVSSLIHAVYTANSHCSSCFVTWDVTYS